MSESESLRRRPRDPASLADSASFCCLTFPGFYFHMPCASLWRLLGSSPIPTVKNSLQMAGYSLERLHVQNMLLAGLG